MTPQDTDRIRRTIEARLDELRGEITDKLGEAALISGGLERSADDTATADFADARRDVQEYHAGQAALARLEAGEYGTCVDCGEEIPAARLQAQPFAIRCVECQERAERASGLSRSTM